MERTSSSKTLQLSSVLLIRTSSSERTFLSWLYLIDSKLMDFFWLLIGSSLPHPLSLPRSIKWKSQSSKIKKINMDHWFEYNFDYIWIFTSIRGSASVVATSRHMYWGIISFCKTKENVIVFLVLYSKHQSQYPSQRSIKLSKPISFATKHQIFVGRSLFVTLPLFHPDFQK